MKTLQNPSRLSPLAVFILIAFLGLIPLAADAASTCRSSKGGSTTDALGEEFPELVCRLIAIALGPQYLGLVAWVPIADALGEEFPERPAHTDRDSLGEEFPERGAKPDHDALGEEFPEKLAPPVQGALGEEFPE